MPANRTFLDTAVILAGGRATGMRPLSLDIPKALTPFLNTPVLERTLRQLARAGIRHAVVSTSAEKEEHFSRWAENRPNDGLRSTISVVRGGFPGTAATVMQMVGDLPDRFLVIYGDSLLSMDYEILVESHWQNRGRGGVVTIVYHRPPDLSVPDRDGRTYHGVLAVDSENRLTRFEEKPVVSRIVGDFCLANAAVFAIERQCLLDARDWGCRDFSYHLFQDRLVHELGTMFGHDIGSGFRRDVGSVRRYFDLSMEALRGELAAEISLPSAGPGLWIDADAECAEGADLQPPVIIGAGSRVAQGAQVGPRAILGCDVVIGPMAEVEDSILWDGSCVSAGAKVSKSILGRATTVGPDVILSAHSTIGSYASVCVQDWRDHHE